MSKADHLVVLWLIAPIQLAIGAWFFAKGWVERGLVMKLAMSYLLLTMGWTCYGYLLSYFFLDDPDVLDRRKLNARKILGTLLFTFPICLCVGFIYGILAKFQLEGYESGWQAHGTYGLIVGGIFAVPVTIFYWVWVFVPRWFNRKPKEQFGV